MYIPPQRKLLKEFTKKKRKQYFKLKKMIFVTYCFKFLYYKINDKIKYYKYTWSILFPCIKLCIQVGWKLLNYLLIGRIFLNFDIAIYLAWQFSTKNQYPSKLIFNEEKNKDSFGHEVTQKFCHLLTTEELLQQIENRTKEENSTGKIKVVWEKKKRRQHHIHKMMVAMLFLIVN